MPHNVATSHSPCKRRKSPRMWESSLRTVISTQSNATVIAPDMALIRKATISLKDPLCRLFYWLKFIFCYPSVLAEEVVKDVRVSCNSEDITLTISTYIDYFNGMIYPKGLSKNSTCMSEYIQERGAIVYSLPLRSCNTMNTDVVRIQTGRGEKSLRLPKHFRAFFFFCSSCCSRLTALSTSTPLWCSHTGNW